MTDKHSDPMTMLIANNLRNNIIIKVNIIATTNIETAVVETIYSVRIPHRNIAFFLYIS